MATETPRNGAPALLSVRGLRAQFNSKHGVVHAVNGIDLDVHARQTVGIVGESGSGKSATVLSILGLLPSIAEVTDGQILFRGRDLRRLSKGDFDKVRGREIGAVFQDPITSLNPVYRIGWQIGEALRAHDRRLSSRAVRVRARELLDLVRIPNADRILDRFPHELSGGMCQRVCIAIAIANRPPLLVADEPTTALDVTTQAHIFDVLETARRETDAAMILITHNLGIVAEMAAEVVVMYGGSVVERGTTTQIFRAPHHPYTQGLMDCLPRVDQRADSLMPIQGHPPDLVRMPPGCTFQPRCKLSMGREKCVDERPVLLDLNGDGHHAACHFSYELAHAKELA